MIPILGVRPVVTNYKPSSELFDIKHYRARIVDSALVVGTILGLITIVITQLDGDGRALVHRILDFAGFSVLAFVSLRRKQLRVQHKVSTLVTVIFVLSMVDIYRTGLMSDNYILLLLIPFFTILGFNQTTTVVVSFCTVFCFLSIGALFSAGVLTSENHMAANLEFSDWVEKVLILTIVSVVVVLTLIIFDQNSSKFILELNDKSEELQSREANLTAITESTNDIIGLFDSNKKVVAYNKAFTDFVMTTQGIAMYEGLDLLKHFNPTQVEVFEKHMDRALNGEKFKETFEYSFRGEILCFMLSYNPVYRKNKAIGFTLFAEDITELRRVQERLMAYNTDLETEVKERTKELENKNQALHEGNVRLEKTLQELKETQGQLLQADKMSSLGVLAAGVGHEINNPLNFILNGVKTIESQLEDNPETTVEELGPFFNVIYDGVNRASKIVKSLSRFSRKADDLNETCDLHGILDNCLTILQSETKNKAQIKKEFSNEHLQIIGSESKLHQVFLNILFNAAQAIQDQGKITIQTGHREDRIVVSISDNGCGISEENMKKISDPFYTTKAAGEGTGLGLFITYGVIEEHQGDIQVTSKEGEGTNFTISFPA